MRIYILLIATLLLTIGSGVVSGRLDNRWGQTTDLVGAGQRLQELPEQFGPWVRQASQPVNSDIMEMLQCAGGLHHIYRSRDTGDVVSMALFVGPPGPMSVHTPEVCYSLAGHVQKENASRFKIRESGSAEEYFWSVTFKSNDLQGGLLRVAYGWNSGHGWTAPDQPRFAFGGEAKLYKLQVASSVATQAELSERDPCLEFLRDFVPVANKRLFRQE